MYIHTIFIVCLSHEIIIQQHTSNKQKFVRHSDSKRGNNIDKYDSIKMRTEKHKTNTLPNNTKWKEELVLLSWVQWKVNDHKTIFQKAYS